MELRKQPIRKNQMGKRIIDQFIIDDDYNVPDAKRDVQRIVVSEGTIKIDDVRTVENYVRVSGKLYFQILYVTEGLEPMLASLEGKIPFEEMVYVDEQKDSMYIVKDKKVDFSSNVIHSRKIGIKAIVELELGSEQMAEEELTVDVESDVPIYKKQRELNLLKLCTTKKDTYRIKEEMVLPGTKETIGELLWYDVAPRKLDTRLGEGDLLLNGELLAFCFYESPDGKLDWMEQMIPYEGRIDCYGIDPSMYHHVTSDLTDINVDIRMDEDGEMRIIGIEATLEVRLAVYEEENVELLEDVYSLAVRCNTETEPTTYEEPVLQNHSKCKLTERLSLPELKEDILQICHSSGMVQTDHMEMTENGILVEGVLHVSFLYVKANDTIPFDVWQGMIPFSHVIACGEIGENICYDITSALEQLNISPLGGDGVEVKAVLAFHCLLKRSVETETIVALHTETIPTDELEKRPGIVGYIVKEGDTLWDLAKKYNTTMESIREVNNLSDDSIKTGDRMLIFKENMSIL